MCGIFGVWPFKPVDGLAEQVRAGLDAMAHRGPDHQGLWQDGNTSLILGHRRLSIIDTSPAAHQPMVCNDSGLAITFNGEIYNFKELRADLANRGVCFRTASDTEVLLRGYEVFGMDVLAHLVGMFAFAIWDAPKQRLFLARDRAGEKPLHIAATPDGFAFASEIAALRVLPWVDSAIDPNALALYLQLQYIPAPLSIYAGIRKLPPAHAMIVEADGSSRIWRYWDPMDAATKPAVQETVSESLDHLDRLLDDAVRGQMIADVPLGAFLSGGIDSTAVVASMVRQSTTQVRTFTIAFDSPRFDESRHAAAVARHLGTNHTTLRFGEQDLLSLVPQVPKIYGEPFADSSALPTRLVSWAARQHVTVSLSGDGGDELFGGYVSYDRLETLMRLAHGFGPLIRLARPILERMTGRPRHWANLIGADAPSAFRLISSAMTSDDVSSLTGIQPHYPTYDLAWSRSAELNLRRRAMLADFNTYMPEDVLVKVDRAAMSVSLETRAPLLDHRVMEFALRLPAGLIHRKRILKQLAFQHVPHRLLDRPKQGFGVPLDAWFRGPLRSLADAVLPTCLNKVGVSDCAFARHLLAEHLAGRADHGQRLWTLLVLGLWNAEKTA